MPSKKREGRIAWIWEKTRVSSSKCKVSLLSFSFLITILFTNKSIWLWLSDWNWLKEFKAVTVAVAQEKPKSRSFMRSHRAGIRITSCLFWKRLMKGWKEEEEEECFTSGLLRWVAIAYWDTYRMISLQRDEQGREKTLYLTSVSLQSSKIYLLSVVDIRDNFWNWILSW